MSPLEVPTRRWTVEEYERMGREGFFGPDERVELLNGQIIAMSPIGYRHARAVELLTEFFILAARKRYLVKPGNPFVLDDFSEPEPDLVLARRETLQLDRHPESSELYLVVEVADSTIR